MIWRLFERETWRENVITFPPTPAPHLNFKVVSFPNKKVTWGVEGRLQGEKWMMENDHSCWNLWHFAKVTPFGSSWHKCHSAETGKSKREWWAPREIAWSPPPSSPCKFWFSQEEVRTMHLAGVTRLWWLQSSCNVYCSKETHIQPQESCLNSGAVGVPAQWERKLWTHGQADKRQDCPATFTRASEESCSYWWLQSRCKCLEQPTQQLWGFYTW